MYGLHCWWLDNIAGPFAIGWMVSDIIRLVRNRWFRKRIGYIGGRYDIVGGRYDIVSRYPGGLK